MSHEQGEPHERRVRRASGSYFASNPDVVAAHARGELDVTLLPQARDMATAGAVVVAEVDEIVGVGEIAPEEVATPHLFVDYLVPLTAECAVDLVVTEHATFAVRDGAHVLIAVADGTSPAWVREHTGAAYREEIA